jgi:hypothetical protein
VLAASVFHFGTVTIANVKAEMQTAGYPVRRPSGARAPVFLGGQNR